MLQWCVCCQQFYVETLFSINKKKAVGLKLIQNFRFYAKKNNSW